jgi:uncharacterized membrane protein (DUF106 family)
MGITKEWQKYNEFYWDKPFLVMIIMCAVICGIIILFFLSITQDEKIIKPNTIKREIFQDEQDELREIFQQDEFMRKHKEEIEKHIGPVFI